MKAAIYMRISLDSTGQGLGIERQREACLRHAAYKGWEVAGEYVDNSVSATKKKPRPQYQRLLEDVKGGGIDVVLAWKLDRLTRKPIEIEDWINLHESHGVNLATADGDIDLSTGAGQTIAGILASIARGEMKTKSERQKAAGFQRAKSGQPWSSGRAFGFESDGVTHHAAEAPILRQMYEDLASGVSQHGIARDLNDAGVLTVRGKQWRQESVRAVLKNPRYAGKRAYNGEVLGDAAWKPLVSDELWNIAQGYMSGQYKRSSPKNLLTGLATCGICGNTLQIGYAHGRRQYACQPGRHLVRDADKLDDLLTLVILRRLQRGDFPLLVADKNAPTFNGMQDDLGKLRLRLDSLAEEFADGDLTASQLRTATARLQDRIRGLERDMARPDLWAAVSAVAHADNITEAWEKSPLARRQRIISALLTVTVQKARAGGRFDPEDITIEWKTA